jgi:MEMO1 family protein
MGATLRRAAFAGSWYPRTAGAIAAEVDGYLEAAAAPAPPGRLLALVSPHAGLHYSGPVAAHSYALLRGRAACSVVLVGPAHRASFDGVAVHARGAWETPLGSVPIDEGLAAALIAADPMLFDDPAPHACEHSLEMQLPFLQRVLPELRIVPILMGSQSRDEVDALARALARAAAGRELLLVASSDLSHYQPSHVASQRDAEVIEEVRRLDSDALMSRLETRDNVACGGGPIVAVLKAARALGADRVAVLRYADSGDVGEHDKTHVVGYLAAAVLASQ